MSLVLSLTLITVSLINFSNGQFNQYNQHNQQNQFGPFNRFHHFNQLYTAEPPLGPCFPPMLDRSTDCNWDCGDGVHARPCKGVHYCGVNSTSCRINCMTENGCDEDVILLSKSKANTLVDCLSASTTNTNLCRRMAVHCGDFNGQIIMTLQRNGFPQFSETIRRYQNNVRNNPNNFAVRTNYRPLSSFYNKNKEYGVYGKCTLRCGGSGETCEDSMLSCFGQFNTGCNVEVKNAINPNSFKQGGLFCDIRNVNGRNGNCLLDCPLASTNNNQNPGLNPEIACQHMRMGCKKTLMYNNIKFKKYLKSLSTSATRSTAATRRTSRVTSGKCYCMGKICQEASKTFIGQVTIDMYPPAPTKYPTKFPSLSPTPQPTKYPTVSPTLPTKLPTLSPTLPTKMPVKYYSPVNPIGKKSKNSKHAKSAKSAKGKKRLGPNNKHRPIVIVKVPANANNNKNNNNNKNGKRLVIMTPPLVDLAQFANSIVPNSVKPVTFIEFVEISTKAAKKKLMKGSNRLICNSLKCEMKCTGDLTCDKLIVLIGEKCLQFKLMCEGTKSCHGINIRSFAEENQIECSGRISCKNSILLFGYITNKKMQSRIDLKPTLNIMKKAELKCERGGCMGKYTVIQCGHDFQECKIQSATTSEYKTSLSGMVNCLSKENGCMLECGGTITSPACFKAKMQCTDITTCKCINTGPASYSDCPKITLFKQ